MDSLANVRMCPPPVHVLVLCSLLSCRVGPLVAELGACHIAGTACSSSFRQFFPAALHLAIGQARRAVALVSDRPAAPIGPPPARLARMDGFRPDRNWQRGLPHRTRWSRPGGL